MLQRNHLIQPVDVAIKEERVYVQSSPFTGWCWVHAPRDVPRISSDEIAEMQKAFNCNLSGDDDEYLDEDFISDNLTIVGPDYFFTEIE